MPRFSLVYDDLGSDTSGKSPFFSFLAQPAILMYRPRYERWMSYDDPLAPEARDGESLLLPLNEPIRPLQIRGYVRRAVAKLTEDGRVMVAVKRSRGDAVRIGLAYMKGEDGQVPGGPPPKRLASHCPAWIVTK